ncbi:MAG TPA: type II toxin-antitoxin system RelE/ParE family toxin [Clostridia bacterium]|jgi:mRNA interferase RelE/StbE|nr:MAG: Plasmid stabilization system protein [Firmicutes bacterium ADurb.Bin099]HHT95597.1 type II toxin-antitoxin system RelE/ParE family toxin [Clostridiaceae bacterium]HOF27526.1 type II toxin-antitoxin system RelE/ParE family toxin [Clostridia bacterium]HOR90447.1 type II toxin-antitoxin system RelE/ParE family toxin [Clostridia bacterium]HPL08813.1 type II toxin-antitoxin system RelE/ParE family toxin [Clostridia bacterium]
MTYSIEVTSRFEREFKKLDRYTKLMINAWIEKNLLDCENLGTCKKTLIENRKGLWRCRIGDYRLICHIEDKKFIIFALNIGHRSEVYKS